MSGAGTEARSPLGEAEAAGRGASGDAAAWTLLTSAPEEAGFLAGWLNILCRALPGLRQAAVLFDRTGQGPFPPATRWAASPALEDIEGFAAGAGHVIDLALRQRQPAIEGVGDPDGPAYAAYPFLVAGQLHGAVVVEGLVADNAAARRLLRHLQWSAPWVEAHLLRGRDGVAEDLARRAGIMVETLAAVMAAPGFTEAAHALAALLDRRLGCERVAVGRRAGQRTRLEVLAQTAQFDRRSEQSRLTAAAMDEAVDQGTALAAPAPMRGYLALAQQELSRANGNAEVLTLPMPRGAEAFGAITLLRGAGRPFTQAEVDIADAIAAAAGPILGDKWDKGRALPAIALARGRAWLGRLFGARHPGLKLAVLAGLLLVVAAATVQGSYRVHARGQVQGEVRRVVTAPFDGYIRAQHFKAGEVVQAGALLAEMQDYDLVLDRLRHLSRQRQYQQELDRALARRDLAQVNIARAQVDQAAADIELADQMLARTQLRAPFASIIVSGDLSQSVGSPVARGDTLFELAPLDQYRMTLVVPEAQIREARAGQRGQVLLAALPDRAFALEVVTVTPVARAADGINGFEVRARLLDADERVRPGMEGVAKLEAGRRHMVWIWSQGLLHWARIRLWALLP